MKYNIINNIIVFDNIKLIVRIISNIYLIFIISIKS